MGHRIITVMGLVLGLSIGGPAPAQTDVTPLAFETPIELDRGILEPGWDNSYRLGFDDACAVVTQDWGWNTCADIASFVIYHVPGVEMTVIKVPNSDGAVDIRDWTTDARAATVSAIESDLREGAASATEQLGVPVTFDGWVVEPTLNADAGYLYFATRLVWDGQPLINIEATVFDAEGFIPFQIIPQANAVTEAEAEALIDATLARYVPNADMVYDSAAVAAEVPAGTQSAVTVLSQLAGLQPAAAGTGASTAATELLNRYWFIAAGALVLLALAVMFGGRRGRNSDDGSGAA